MIIVYILLAILVLEFLIFVHELGHYTAGRLLGFRILGFMLGFGPAIFKWKKGETTYALRAIPFGGACQFDGEDEEAENDPRRFNANPVWKRLIVIFAGPFTNILVAYLIAFFIFLCTPVPNYALNPATGQQIPVITSVSADGAAKRAGLYVDDQLVAINGAEPVPADGEDIYDAFVRVISGAGSDLVVTVRRGGELIDVPVSGAYSAAAKKTLLGIGIGGLIDGYTRHGFFESFGGAGRYLWNIIRLTGEGIAGMFKNGIHQGDVSGIVGTVGIMVDVAQESTLNLVYVACILSLSLGLFNLIPFPALDGGRILFLLIEAIIGRPLNRKVEAWVNGIGLALLFALMIVVTVNDVIGLFR